AAAALGDTAGAADVVVPERGAAVEVGDYLAPVQPPRTLHRCTDVEQAMAEDVVDAGGTDVGGRAQQRLPDEVVVEVRERLPHQRRGTGDQRPRERGALPVPVAGIVGCVVGAGSHHVAGRD